MPNHCYTTMYVNGPTDDVERFGHVVESNKQFIPTLIPFPENLLGEEIIDSNGTVIGRAYSDGGYDWCLNNWGCKWGDCDTEVDSPMYVQDGIGDLTVRFWTPWGPAIQGLTTISAMFPSLRFEISYEDEGGNFYGFAVFVNGRFGNCSVDYDDPHYPQFTGDDDENSAELVGKCLDYCESQALRRFSEQLELAAQ